MVVVNGVKTDRAAFVSGVPLGLLLFSSLVVSYCSPCTLTTSLLTLNLKLDSLQITMFVNGYSETSERHRLFRKFGQKMGYGISTCQMQHDAADKKKTNKVFLNP